MANKGLVKSISSIFKPSNWTDSALLEHERQKSYSLDPANFREGGFFMWTGDKVEHNFCYSGRYSALTAYTKCPPVAAIINRQAQAYINGKTWVLNSKAKEATTPDANKLKNLLRRPNPLQSWKQFEAQGYVYQRLFGYNVVLAIKPAGFKENIDASSLWNIPATMLEIEESGKLIYQQELRQIIKSVKFVYGKDKTDLNIDDLLIQRDFTPSFDTMVLPESRILSLEAPINLIIGSYESEEVLMNNRGPKMVISSNQSDASGNVPLSTKEKDTLQNEFKKYGLRKEQWQQIITSANISVQAVGFNTRDLMLHESRSEATKAICDGLNYPAHLLGLLDPTFNNQNAAEKGLYQNSIIPDAENIYEQWNNFFALYDRNLKLDKDYSHIAVLQEDKQSEAQARLTRNNALRIEFEKDMLTVNRWLELNGEDTIAEGNVYWSEWKNIRGITDMPLNNQNPINDGTNQPGSGEPAPAATAN